MHALLLCPLPIYPLAVFRILFFFWSFLVELTVHTSSLSNGMPLNCFAEECAIFFLFVIGAPRQAGICRHWQHSIEYQKPPVDTHSLLHRENVNALQITKYRHSVLFQFGYGITGIFSVLINLFQYKHLPLPLPRHICDTAI